MTRKKPPLPLRLVSQGICCSVGNSAPAAIAAMNARLANISFTTFVDEANQPIPGASLYQVPLTGDERLFHMARMATEECLTTLPSVPDRPLPIILLGSEGTGKRGERQAQRMDRLLAACRPESGFDPRTRGICAGKAGIGEALRLARDIFSAPDAPEYVLIVGVDSFLEPETFNHFIQARRILCTTNSDGFIPGEAGAAIALTARTGDGPALWIEGIGQGFEPASPESAEKPLLAQGLADALRAALSEASAPQSEYAFQAHAVSGEQWFMKEAALVIGRVITEVAPGFDGRMICLTVGEVGAACGPLGLAWLGAEMALGTLGARGFLHFSNDDGQRTALALNFRV